MKVIVIQADGLQLAALGAYGNVWADTPHLDRLASESVVFDQHFADVPSKEGVRQALFFGRHVIPSRDGEAIVRPAPSLMDCLQSRNVRCISIPALPTPLRSGDRREQPVALIAGEARELSAPPPGWGEGWGEGCETDWPSALRILNECVNGLFWIDASVLPPWHVPGEHFAKQCEDWEFEEEPVPWSDPAPGWLHPTDEVSFARLQRSYAALVQALDEKIGQWIDLLSQQPWWPEAALILTAGRGQNLGEHGLIGDFRPWLHEELVHLPLLIRLPHEAQAGRRTCAITQTIDIPAAILDLFDIDKPHDWHGASLLPLCHGGAPIRNFACVGLKIGAASEYALRTADAGIILPHNVVPEDPTRHPMFFVKPDDRWEVNDLRQANLEEADSLEHMLRNHIVACESKGEATSVVSKGA